MTPTIERFIQNHPAAALAFAPLAGAALVLALPFIGWIVVLRASSEAILSKLHQNPTRHTSCFH